MSEAMLWDRIVSDSPESLLGRLDEGLLQEFVTTQNALDHLRPLFLSDPSEKTIRVSYVSLQQQWLRLASEIGLTPASRSRLKVPQSDPAEPSEFAQLLSRMGCDQAYIESIG